MKFSEMKISTQRIVSELANRYPDQTQFRKSAIVDIAKENGYTGKDFYCLMSPENRVKIGTYDLSSVIVDVPQKVISNDMPQTAMAMQSITNDEKTYASIDETFVPWGPYSDIVKIIKSGMFYPTYISGLSGNGKTFMVEQACAKLKKEFIRVQINPETDEDDLIGGFRLINGETVFAKGPVLKAMENGAILLLDEIDRATNKIMCLQGILEGKPVLVKKTGEVVKPSPGFNVIADKLVQWSDVIRKTFYDDGVDELISTRRLCHIVQTFSIFNNRMKAIDMCISRFDEDTKDAFLDLYTKVDEGVLDEFDNLEVDKEAQENYNANEN